MVEVAGGGAAGAAGEPAGAVAGSEVAGEVGGDAVGGAAVGEVGAGLGVGEDALERRCVRGEVSGGVGGDRTVPVELGGFVRVSEQGEHRHGDQHPGHDRRVIVDRFAVDMAADTGQEQVGGGIEDALRAGSRVGRR